MVNIKMIFGGCYQEVSYQGIMMGQLFEGKFILVYNNVSKEYIIIFIDNMGIGMMIVIGKYDEKMKVMEFKGDMVNLINGKKILYCEVYIIVDVIICKMEMYDIKNGKEYKSMEIIMKKKQYEFLFKKKNFLIV